MLRVLLLPCAGTRRTFLIPPRQQNAERCQLCNDSLSCFPEPPNKLHLSPHLYTSLSLLLSPFSAVFSSTCCLANNFLLALCLVFDRHTSKATHILSLSLTHTQTHTGIQRELPALSTRSLTYHHFISISIYMSKVL